MKLCVRRGLGLGVVMGVVAGSLVVPVARGQGAPRNEVKLSLGKKLNLVAGKREPVSPEAAAKIKACIDGLVEVDGTGFRYAPAWGVTDYLPPTERAQKEAMRGQAFLPMAERTYAEAMRETDARKKVAAEARALVEWGPDALPYLLKALEDKRETKWTFKSSVGRGGISMWFGNEVAFNPMNPAEAKALEGLPQKPRQDLPDYTVRVGDVCFVVIGEIVGRPYEVAHKTQITTTINSPVFDEDMCRRVRMAWAAEDAWKVVFDSLLTDYATDAAFNGKSLDGWGVGSNYKIEAALRMLYYFPAETAPTIASRLEKLDVPKTESGTGGMMRDVANGVRVKDFIEAVRRSPAKEVHEAVVGVFQRTGDWVVMLAAAPVVEDKVAVKRRMGEFLKAMPRDNQVDSQKIALTNGAVTLLGDDALPLLQEYLADASAMGANYVAQALHKVKSAGSDAMLLRLLEDKRRATPNGVRVCDWAAAGLAEHHPELMYPQMTFESTRRTDAEKDPQIAAIKAALGKGR